jgi:hypothetical protein
MGSSPTFHTKEKPPDEGGFFYLCLKRQDDKMVICDRIVKLS